jgi:hypothetical protein
MPLVFLPLDRKPELFGRENTPAQASEKRSEAKERGETFNSVTSGQPSAQVVNQITQYFLILLPRIFYSIIVPYIYLSSATNSRLILEQIHPATSIFICFNLSPSRWL